MYFWLFNENGFHIRPVNFCKHIDNLVYAKAIIYEQSGDAGTSLLGCLQKCSSCSGRCERPKISIKNLDGVNRNARRIVLIADHQGSDFILARWRWRQWRRGVTWFEKSATM